MIHYLEHRRCDIIKRSILVIKFKNIFIFKFWQIKNKVELLNKLNNACLKLDSTFQEYLKLDSLLGSSYYGMDSNGNRYTQDKLLIESKLVAIIDEIQSMQNTLNNSKLLQIIEQYIELFREADKIYLETYKLMLRTNRA